MPRIIAAAPAPPSAADPARTTAAAPPPAQRAGQATSAGPPFAYGRQLSATVPLRTSHRAEVSMKLPPHPDASASHDTSHCGLSSTRAASAPATQRRSASASVSENAQQLPHPCWSRTGPTHAGHAFLASNAAGKPSGCAADVRRGAAATAAPIARRGTADRLSPAAAAAPATETPSKRGDAAARHPAARFCSSATRAASLTPTELSAAAAGAPAAS